MSSRLTIWAAFWGLIIATLALIALVGIAAVTDWAWPW